MEKEGLVSSCWVPPHPPFPPMKTQWGSFPLPTLPLPRHRSPNNPAKVNDFIIEIIGYIWPLVQQKWFLHASFKSEDILSQCVSRSFPITRITTLIAQDAPILHQLGLIGPFLAPGFVTIVAFYWPTMHSSMMVVWLGYSLSSVMSGGKSPFSWDKIWLSSFLPFTLQLKVKMVCLRLVFT